MKPTQKQFALKRYARRKQLPTGIICNGDEISDPTGAMRIRIQNLVRSLVVRMLTSVALCAFCLSSLAQSDPLDVWRGPASFPSGFGLVNGVAYGNGTFVAVGNNGGALALSPDGLSWTRYLSPPVISYGGVIFGGGQFFAWGFNNPTNYILRSSDGQAWTKVYEFAWTGQILKAAAYGNNRVFFGGSDRIITTTLPATNWVDYKLPVNPSGVTFGMGRFVACNGSGVLSSADGVVWRYDYVPTTAASMSGIAYGNGSFVAPWRTNSATDSGFLVSTNLTSWNFIPIQGTTNYLLGAATFGGGQFIAFLGYKAYTSPDGSTWTYRTNAYSSSTLTVTYGLGTFLTSAVQQSGVFANPASSPPSNLALAMFPGVSITGTEGQTYRIESSTNLNPGSVWQTLTNLTLPFSPYLWVDTSASNSPRRFYRAVQIE